ncbi:hypothetical protein TVAG_042290 [Trichomonas vaginalis G3]|uniref:Uncharacterized protein n=1 Tax=Trichomonas vaginalis (strain ATCC PRA-98 / G3) TaxID=412133 RepID=A2EUW8_TRIV3|nr:hypothetical protein TVAGG3_0192510 [Trichomonas vaginalis G3]EAY03577.1 hypothetical protein TVAG_042290 [Trichomonas vaginalis G3]KAI5550083.1 hypothetical protein TVAGG3_0192510 [Trichomonas vaginalis G3]|eukprot:XP_001315800.1 hypothetical protein [Trichomonas vaginalis G3]
MTCIIFTFSFHACKPLICNTIHASNTNIYVFFHASWEEFFESQEIEENISIINQDTTIQTARNYNIFDSVFKKIHCSRAIHVSANSPKYILIESSSFQDVCSGDNDGGGAIFATHCYTVQNRVCGNNCSISSGRGTFSVVTGERGFLISSSIINCGINKKGQSTFCTVRCFTNISQSNVSHCKSETLIIQKMLHF